MLGAILVLLHLSVTTADYSRYNPGWNGTSVLFDMIDGAGGTMVTDPSLLPGQGNGMLLFVAPGREPPDQDKEDLRDFLFRGNCVLIASDREEDNELLEGIGSSIRIRRADIISVDRFFDDPSSVIAFPTGDDPLSSGIPRLVGNDPSFLEGGTPVYATSLLSFRDTDGDQRLGKGEVLERFTIVSRETLGNGTLYVVSDPSIFINGMLVANPPTENRDFVARILSLRPVLLAEQNYSRTAEGGPLIRVINLVKNATSIEMAAITLSMLLFGLFLAFGRRDA
ncbi:MAG: DUF4350 domain-containing protein [Methanolinea sp.]|nr:DUF4350 domain-containing protein [Methanolinea sp.]